MKEIAKVLLTRFF